MRVSAFATVPALLLWLGACQSSATSDRLTWQTAVDTLGDTIVVRTIGAKSPPQHTLATEMKIGKLEGEDEYTFGSISELAVTADGDIYAFDGQANQLRRYDSLGTFVSNIGRKGGGPGEYDRVNGLAVAADGQLFLWDAGNARVTIYSPHGDPLTTYRMAGGFFTSNAVTLDSAGRVYTRVTIFGEDVSKWRPVLVRYGAGGAPVDTIDVPRFDMPQNTIVARREGSTSQNTVPFSPTTQWAVAPDARFVYGRSDVYAIHRQLADGRLLRIEREADPVPVSAAEREEREAQATWSMRRTDPAWRWNGPPIPEVKPYFTQLRVAQDGRIWVRLSQPGEIDPGADTAQAAASATGSGAGGGVAPSGGDRRPVLRYREPQVWDVFAPDGRFLGQVHFPHDFTLYALRGDHVWGVQRDDLDVQSIVRLRIEPSLATAATERVAASDR